MNIDADLHRQMRGRAIEIAAGALPPGCVGRTRTSCAMRYWRNMRHAKWCNAGWAAALYGKYRLRRQDCAETVGTEEHVAFGP